jgi:hypothetical protein
MGLKIPYLLGAATLFSFPKKDNISIGGKRPGAGKKTSFPFPLYGIAALGPLFYI